ncbi:hypothetical protein B9Z55_012358 [Caenorhabditis nigoni]|uniref:F-box domain-containing protein n=1 Tax=Caenorhabditis nigoni TaxID=1611254 RepID=A0A2G5TXE3_9PELO|nr:hypothetical protein B9Z55_012358 [Caenorhabditis nigoni]
MMFLETVLAQFHIKDKLPIKSKPKNQFPLLKLPRVVLIECIENLNLFEIIIFSLLSNRVKSIAKSIRWSTLDIRLLYGVTGTINICLRLPTHPGLKWIIAYANDKEPSEYPYFESVMLNPEANHFLVLRDNGNAIEDSTQMAAHICKVFRSPIDGIDIGKESLIEWIIEFQPTIRNIWIYNGVITSVKSLDRIFKSLKVTEHFGLEPTAIDEKFQITEPIPFRSITIDDSYWITLPSILNGNNSIILLNDSMLTPMDINTILREWQVGFNLRNLEYLQVRTTTLLDADSYTDELFKDLNLTLGVENDGRPMTVDIDDDWEHTLPEVEIVHNLTRSDGMILSIFGHHEVSEGEKLKILLYLQVWRKQA